MSNLILASSSPYRRALLQRLNLPFECAEPDIDEAVCDGETAIELVQRLSLEKAAKVAQQYTSHLIIGSDQVALYNGDILTKPGNYDRAADQLRQQSGQSVMFYTGLTLFNSVTKKPETDIVTTEVTFRPLSETDISNYLNVEQPWGCAGSFKAEGLGVSLFDSINSCDPTALIGLPLIRLCQMLRGQGVAI